ncbi:MAG: hypothetical protein L0H70_03670 [Xanthomonadales bacterium]|nr:hypothetical protein [Xanthomonadales bacterium]
MDSPYEPPESAELHLEVGNESPDQLAHRVADWLEAH